MSLVTISEAKHLKNEIELEGYVKSLSKKKWFGRKNISDYSLGCTGYLCNNEGDEILIAFKDSDAKIITNNLKIKIIGWKKSIHGILIGGKYGLIQIIGFNPNMIKEDILNVKKRKKIISFKEYQKYVENRCGPIYLGNERKKYLMITGAFTQIEKFASKYHNSKVSSAIRYLCKNEYGCPNLSAEQIQTILKIFNISIPWDRILRNSNREKIKKIKTITSKPSFHNIVKYDDHDTIQLETTCDETLTNNTVNKLPLEITIDDSSNNDFNSTATSNTHLDLYMKYRGYYNYYGSSK